jgi:hypothetical protein
MGDYLLAGVIVLLGIGGLYFGLTTPRGDAWGKQWQYVFGGAIFTVLGLVILASQIGWL